MAYNLTVETSILSKKRYVMYIKIYNIYLNYFINILIKGRQY